MGKKFFIKFYYKPEISYSDYELEVFVDNRNICEFKVNDRIESDTSNIEFLVDWFEYNFKFIVNYDKFPIEIEGNNGMELREKAYLIGNNQDKEIEWFEAIHEWSERHLWTFSGLKMIFPNVIFRRVNNKIEISWDSKNKYSKDKHNIRFTNEKGVFLVDIKEFKEEVLRFIKDVREIVEIVRLKLTIPHIGEINQRYAEKKSHRKFTFEDEMLRDLQQYGYNLNSIYDLILINKNDKKIISLVTFYIRLSTNIEEKKNLVRFLAVENFYEASNFILKEFYETEDEKYREVLANTLSIIADNSILDKIIEIIMNKKYDSSKKPLVYRLHNYKDRNKVIKLLYDLLNKEDLKEYAKYSLNKIYEKANIKNKENF